MCFEIFATDWYEMQALCPRHSGTLSNLKGSDEMETCFPHAWHHRAKVVIIMTRDIYFIVFPIVEQEACLWIFILFVFLLNQRRSV